MAQVKANRQIECRTMRELHQWSVSQIADFWEELWKFGGVVANKDQFGKEYSSPAKFNAQIFETEWFTGARLNFAENLLRFKDDREALVYLTEGKARRAMTYAELSLQVSQVAAGLRRVGIKAGDRVAGLLPNLPEAVVAMLATTSLGAIWSSCSPDFGLQGILDRFGQIEPKVLFSADEYYYSGKTISLTDRVKAIKDRVPSICQLIIIEQGIPEPLPDDAVSYREFLLDPNLAPGSAPELIFERMPFEHPIYILYSSGTTGVPKCIVHGAGGTLLQHLKELLLHTDLRSNDTVFYYTTCGWMMWNWLVSSLAIGSRIVLFDGSPTHPGLSRLFNLIDEEQITVFGTSAKFLSAVEKFGYLPKDHHELSSLRTILSTGSPLLPQSFDYVYQSIKADLQLASISGGTDIVSCFALGDPTGAVHRGELQCNGLGMAVEVFDDNGLPLTEEAGELVCTKPFPSMPVGFWNDPQRRNFIEAYFGRFPNVWRHGDWVKSTNHYGLIIYGRSDAVLNPGGVRIGTAELYRAVEALREVSECLAVGQEWDGDERIILFIKLSEATAFDHALELKIKQHIKQALTPRHVPAKIIAVPEIPRTINGKIVELAVRNVIHGRPVKNSEALLNPQALDFYRNLKELES